MNTVIYKFSIDPKYTFEKTDINWISVYTSNRSGVQTSFCPMYANIMDTEDNGKLES